MDQPMFVAIASIVGTIIVIGAVLFLAANGDVRRLSLGLRILRDKNLAEQVRPVLEAAETKEKPVKPSGVPLRLLALLQREGRLLDFLMEEIATYPDAQVGAAVRDIHRHCRDTLKEHLVLEPVIGKNEGDVIDVPVGFDRSAIRLTGNVTGQPPFKGTLQHHGWRVREIKLALPPEGQDEFVLMPAEVELS